MKRLRLVKVIVQPSLLQADGTALTGPLGIPAAEWPTYSELALAVLVQPVFVLDDGETVTEMEHPPLAIPAAEWPTYSSERFPAETKAWEKQLNAETPPNRAARRTKPKR